MHGDDHHHQHPRAPADLEQIEGTGALSYAAPGSPEADDFDATMAEDLAAFDAEILARDGPDALTSDRAYRLAQFRAAQSSSRDVDQ